MNVRVGAATAALPVTAVIAGPHSGRGDPDASFGQSALDCFVADGSSQ